MLFVVAAAEQEAGLLEKRRRPVRALDDVDLLGSAAFYRFSAIADGDARARRLGQLEGAPACTIGSPG